MSYTGKCVICDYPFQGRPLQCGNCGVTLFMPPIPPDPEAELRTLRARLSRLSALLDEAEAALGAFVRAYAESEFRAPVLNENVGLVIEFSDDVFYDIVIGDLRLAASVSAKIAKEKSE